MTTDPTGPICRRCSYGDHLNHSPNLAGICIGCSCDWRSPTYSDGVEFGTADDLDEDDDA